MLLLRSMSIKPLLKAAALMLLPWLAWSCQWMTEDFDDVIDGEATQYINVTISVSASSDPMTRAVPEGDEDGDGLEKGNDRENNVNDITLIFYQDGTGATDGTGINTNSDAVTVLCVKRYEVHPVTNATADLPANHATIPANEVLYSTGNQRLKETELQPGETYRVLVVANAVVSVKVGDKIKDVRDLLLTSVYSGSGVGINATDFVMSSERDAVVTLSNPTITTVNGENRFIYYFDCIHIERLAARIDYWANKSNGYKTKQADNTTDYTVPGYEYTVWKRTDTNATGPTSNDRFVLTSITPFNLNNGNEYMVKRTNDASNPYLAVETGNNWVIDPYTTGKTGTAHPDYLVSTLASVTTTFANNFNVTMASQQENVLTIGEKPDVIVGYTKENTLSGGESKLYYYATGIAFEGYYYKNGIGAGERRVYYHFIRHHGESDEAYNALTAETIDDAKTTLCPQTPAMNYGIVRNNIYRISIDKITEDAAMQVTIKVKKWDTFRHSTIYM